MGVESDESHLRRKPRHICVMKNNGSGIIVKAIKTECMRAESLESY
jgi:hypothetical protein